jgi:hypothetical protein
MEYTGNLLDLKTDLRSLKFDPQTPYVQKEIDESVTGIQSEVQSRVDDVQRISKLLRSNQGLKFIANQGLLNILSEENKPLGQRVVSTVVNTASTVGTILAQTAIAGTGAYLTSTDFSGKAYLKKSGNILQNIFSSDTFITDNESKTDEEDKFTEIEPGWAKDFDGNLKNKDSKFKRKKTFNTTSTLDYSNPDSKVIRLGLGLQGSRSARGTERGIDQINYLDVQTQPLQNLGLEDIIPFSIEVYEPGRDVEYLYFRAYIESLNDNFTGNWNSTSYIGRAEEVYNYTGFKRDISFAFKIAAHSELELFPLYKKLNRLVGTTAPSYSSVFMRGIFVKLTIGDYLISVPGFFSSVQLTWSQPYPWETRPWVKYITGPDEIAEERQGTPRVPHILDVSVSFTPIHNFTPSYKTPFIADQTIVNGVGLAPITLEKAPIE